MIRYCNKINNVVPSRPNWKFSQLLLNNDVIKVKSCYNPLRLGTVIVLVSSGIDFVNTPRLYSDPATRYDRFPIWPYGLCQREP